MRKYIILLLFITSSLFAQSGTVTWLKIIQMQNDSTLMKKNNGSDILNKTTFRNNLGVYSTSQTDGLLAAKTDTTAFNDSTAAHRNRIKTLEDSTKTAGEITALLAPKFNTSDFGSYFNTNWTAKGLRQGAYLSDTTKFLLNADFNSSFDTRLGTKTLDNITAGTTNVHLTTSLKSNYDNAYSHSWQISNGAVMSKDTLPYKIYSFTTAQRDSWLAPENGWIIRNSSLDAYQAYNGTWQTLASGEWTEANYLSKKDTTDYVRYTTSNSGYIPYNSRAGVLANSTLYFNGTQYGIGTASPAEVLDVNGSSVFGSATERLSLASGGLGFNRRVVTGAIYNSSASAYQFAHTANATPANDYLALQVYNGAGAQVNVRALIVNGAGNVGINKTANINSKFAVVGLPTYADNTAALAGGLTAGDFYMTSTGQVMVTY